MTNRFLTSFVSRITNSEFFFYILIFGIVIRLTFVLSSDFPLNDGGLFYTMVQDLIKADFHLPVYTSYNHAGIPFAYPPFSFYLVAAIAKFFSLNLVQIFKFFPVFISILTIPVFYLLSRQLLTIRTALLATFVFTALPRSFEWHIMGGGITRSLGFFFSLIAVVWGIKLFKKPNKKFLGLSCVFITLSILIHLEWVLFAVCSLLVISLSFKNKRKILPNLLIAIGIALALSSFWWILIITKHGLEPFWSFSKTGLISLETAIYPLFLTIVSFTDEPFLTPFGVLGLLGAVVCLFTKRFWLPIWFIIPLIIAPRSSPNLIVVPLALTAGVALSEIVIPQSKKTGMTPSVNWYNKIVFLLLAFYSVFSLGGLIFLNNLYFKSISGNQREAMTWIKNNTDKVGRFLLITQTPGNYWGMDNISEWFPALTERASLITPQGTEWLGDQKFYRRVMFYSKLKDCYDKGLSCLEKVVQEEGVDFDFIYLEKTGQKSGNFDRTAFLKYQLLNSPKYLLVYEGEGAMVFEEK